MKCNNIKKETRFGRWKIISDPIIYFDKNRGRTYYFYRAICDCGVRRKVHSYSFLYGSSKSCGCLAREHVSKANTTHGFRRSRFYCTYRAIISRCGKVKYYKGIKNLWKSFEEFRDDMYKSYLIHAEKYGEKQTTIERIDCRGHYSKENCKWITKKEQSLNKKDSRFLTINGITKNHSTWAKQIGCSLPAFKYRVDIGLDPNLIISLPFKYGIKNLKSIKL